jgi:hypothetical protein
MFHRKDAVSMAVVGLLASCGLAMADTTINAPALSLEPTVVTAQDASAPSGLLMQGLDKVGAAKPLQNLGINIYGWVEGGYDANLRNNQGTGQGLVRRPTGFSEEIGNHFELNQVAVRVERLVDSKKFDVGGLIEANFGTDDQGPGGVEANGFEYQTPGDNPGEVPHINFTQAYVDVNIPVGNGLKLRAGQFYTLLGYEGLDPRGNPFYTHSRIYEVEPLVNSGVLAFYNLNDQWAFAGGVTRGWNQATEDNNGSPDGMGQVTWTPNKQWQFILNAEVGPEDNNDTSHYRTTLNPIAVYQMTDKLKLAAEGIYTYDGGFNGSAGGFDEGGNVVAGTTHAYGDQYGVALYGAYVINDYFTANVRGEWLHTYGQGLDNSTFAFGGGVPSSNGYDITLGVTITPMPKDPILQNISIRPEFRYDLSEDHVFAAGDSGYRDMYTVGADVIVKF